MKSLNFKYLSAKNFLCFGSEGIEIKFSDYGSVVFIRGENRDVKSVDEALPSDEVKISSNGSGKSSIQEIICYGLYGKTIKKPSAISKDGVINNLVGKNCQVDIRWGNYRILRTRKKNSLRFWESDAGEWNDSTELTTGSMDDTQACIEDAVGLTYEAFVSICIFTDDQTSSFLESSGPMKRDIVENLLALSVYRERHERAKKLTSETSSNIKMMAREYDILRGNEEQSKRRLAQAELKESEWKKSKQLEIESLKASLKQRRSLLGKTDHGAEILAYQEAQRTIRDGSEAVEALEKTVEEESSKLALAREKEDKLKDMALDLRRRSDEIKSNVSSQQKVCKDKQRHVEDLKNNKHGATCDRCFGVVDEKNIAKVVDEEMSEIAQISESIKSLLEDAGKLVDESKDLAEKQRKVKDFVSSKEASISDSNSRIREWRKKISDAAKVKEPRADGDELLLEMEINKIEESIKEKSRDLSGKSPFEDIILSEREESEAASERCKEKSAAVKESEENLRYYQYWQTGFGEKGIRKTVVDGIIPQLNNRIAYWLQFLIDNKITLKFDNEFVEVIERNPPDGDPYIYHAMSAGQRRRLNLAVSQAFADIMMLSCGTVPSLVFLDEVTTNIDPLGVQGIYNMIQELSADKQVFITTHDKDLIKMLETSDTIDLVHQGGFTFLRK